jgi:hypothetical protein
MANTPIKMNSRQTAPKRPVARPKASKRLAQLERELRVNEERWQAVMNNPIMGVTDNDQSDVSNNGRLY